MFTLQIAILLLKIVHSDCKYAQIAPALKNIRLQDVEGMVKCLYSMNIFFSHNLLSAEVLTTAW